MQLTNITNIADALGTTTTNTKSAHAISFTTTTDVASGGKIVVTLPSAFSVPASIEADDISGWSAGTTSIASVSSNSTAKTVTITTGTATIQAGLDVSFTITEDAGSASAGIVNPSTAAYYVINVKTTTAADAIIDNGICGVAVSTGNAEAYGFEVLEASLALIQPAMTGEESLTLDGGRLISDWKADQKDCWNVIDATGNGLGWHITVASAGTMDVGSNDLTLNTNGSNFDSSDFCVRVQLVAATTAAGNNDIQHHTSGAGSTSCADIAGSSGDNLVYIGSSATTVATAAATEGMGSYDIFPLIQVVFPAGGYSESCSVDLTVSIVSAP